jgi:hypothetical protein
VALKRKQATTGVRANLKGPFSHPACLYARFPRPPSPTHTFDMPGEGILQIKDVQVLIRKNLQHLYIVIGG